MERDEGKFATLKGWLNCCVVPHPHSFAQLMTLGLIVFILVNQTLSTPP